MQITPVWQQLTLHYQNIRQIHMRQLFSADPERAQTFTLGGGNNFYLDFSKNRINQETLALLIQLAETCELQQAIEAMFKGDKINNTEQRPVLHTALRNQSNQPVFVDGQDVMPQIKAQLEKMQNLVDAIQGGAWRGFSGKPITDVVNIGIGGSDLGPRMVVKALTPYHTGQVRCHFVANVDGSDISETLRLLNPESTLFIVSSKSFSTQETLMNAATARQWLLDKAEDNSVTARHFVAISSRPDKAAAFGIDAHNVFEMWDWVGGRYSLWSAIGLPIALSVGMEHFRELLAGAYDMDCHFRITELQNNMPVILALLGVWYVNFFGCQTQAVLPYDEHLQLLPNYLQQADMESNGKSVKREGAPVTYATGPVIWGGVGTNGQHAFHQLLHQGTVLIPADFIIAEQASHHLPQHHAALYANCLAQSQAMLQGKTEPQAYDELLEHGLSEAEAKRLAPHKVIPGNKPSNTIVLAKLTPRALGALIAMYEHKIFVQSVIWNINAFDQWGVELGKQLGEPILKALTRHETLSPCDSSTLNLIRRFNSQYQ